MGASRDLTLIHRILIKSTDCLSSLAEGAKPVVRSFDAVDAIISQDKVLYLVKMVVDRTRLGTDSTAAFLRTIRMMLGCQQNFKVVFILADNFDDFKQQINYGSGQQYKTRVEIATPVCRQIMTRLDSSQPAKYVKRTLDETPDDEGAQLSDAVTSRPLRRHCSRG
jgi:hypothetical protein